jgi:K+-sensing histidine kinase KdpD
VSDLIVGRTVLPWWRRVLSGSVLERLVRGGEGIDLHVISFEEEPRP